VEEGRGRLEGEREREEGGGVMGPVKEPTAGWIRDGLEDT